MTLPEVAPTRPATTDQIEDQLAFMAAALPSKALDDESGRYRFAVYVSMLTGKSAASLEFMAREACRTLEWFPTPKQCLDLVGQYRPPQTVRDATLKLCSDFAQATFDRWIARLRDGRDDTIGAPERWCRIALEQGLVLRREDGSYVPRMQYHGPFRRYAEPVKPRRKIHIPNADDQREWEAVLAQQRLEEAYGGDILRQAYADQVAVLKGWGW